MAEERKLKGCHEVATARWPRRAISGQLAPLCSIRWRPPRSSMRAPLASNLEPLAWILRQPLSAILYPPETRARSTRAAGPLCARAAPVSRWLLHNRRRRNWSLCWQSVVGGLAKKGRATVCLCSSALLSSRQSCSQSIRSRSDSDCESDSERERD